MQDIRNSDGRKVCQVDERRATVEIRRKDCMTALPRSGSCRTERR